MGTNYAERHSMKAEDSGLFEKTSHEATDDGRSEWRIEWIRKAVVQMELVEEAIDAIDRSIGLREGDVLLCETTCLDYAAHALRDRCGVRELWLVPPQMDKGKPSCEMLEELGLALKDSHGPLIDSLESHGVAYKGLTASVPSNPFKLLVTASFGFDPGVSTFEWPLYNSVWADMLQVDGATGAVIYLDPGDQDGMIPCLSMDPAQCKYYPERFTRATELPGGHVMMAQGEPDGFFHMEDLTDPSNPWRFEATTIDLAVNNGSFTPSVIRAGVRVIKEITLGELASRISRGTTLSEKSLDIREKPDLSEGSTFGFGEAIYHVSYGDGYLPSDGEFYRYPGDVYYIDGTCFHNGAIRPKVLNSMPAAQGRYVVDADDREVLLVSRSSKEIAVYKFISKPTLIGNSVFVVRLGTEITMDYLACWMRGSFAKSCLHNGGKLLSKAVLAGLHVPILDDDEMMRAVRYERSIDERIVALSQELWSLKEGNRFNPLGAIG